MDSPTIYITELINNDFPFIFVKLGDKEYYACLREKGRNCDNDAYTCHLRNGLLFAINYYSFIPNAYCGKWWSKEVYEYFDSVAKGEIKWVNYHTCLIDAGLCIDNTKLELFRSIKNSNRKKLLLGNHLLAKATILFNIDKHIHIPFHDWFDTKYEEILNEILDYFKDDENPMVITCAGMGSKVLIMDLHKRKPYGIYLDIGSGLDYLCTKKDSRGHNISYEEIENYFSELLPDNWNDPNYDYIYEMAKTCIGLHL